MDNDQDDGFLERFRAVLQRIGQLQKAAELTGYSPDQVAKWRDGKAKPPFRPMAILASAADVSLDWLATGGEMEARGFAEDAPPYESAPDADTVLIPLLSAVGSAGGGHQNNGDEEIDRLPFPAGLLRRLGVSQANARFRLFRGDSMLPTLTDGGIVLADVSKTNPRDGGIYAFSVDDDLLIKRLQLGARGLTIISDNTEKYPPETLVGDEVDRVRIMGKVIWSGGVV